jgi:hypothetical protein
MVSFTLRPLCPREIAPGTHWIGGWVGLRAGLDAVGKINLLLLLGFEPKFHSCPAPSVITVPTELSRIRGKKLRVGENPGQWPGRINFHVI